MSKSSSELIAMFTERKTLEEKEVNGVPHVDFYLTAKQAKWLEGVRLQELGYPRMDDWNFIGSHDWAMSRTIHGAGQVRMTLDGSDVKDILGPAVYVVR